ncbi:glycoside hydrolase family 3 C-terminal domain-containing protein [Streptomyces sp. NPDC048278]|uniref:glycoside hydrolase family 3 C-terminal domain-containing protein n=1 Tax=Streptomyces sp. NPDC048278 TaxID=3155809 RepID=UPI00344959D5
MVTRRGTTRSLITLGVATVAFAASGLVAATTAQAAGGSSSSVPYSLPVTLPSEASSPATDADAPYTPAVLSLISQLEPSSTPTKDEITNADRILTGGTNGTCHNVGTNGGPTDTSPTVSPLCWTDGLGINVTSGSNAGKTTASPTVTALGATMDRKAANAWGQVEGAEGRALMATGLLGPQADDNVYGNWARGLDTPGEDPLVNSEITAAQIEGIQGKGLMSQVKHFVTNNGQGDNTPTTVQDQALHQNLLTAYEKSLVHSGSSAVMCSYQIFQDDTSGVPSTGVPVLDSSSSYADGSEGTTWPLNQMHYSCEQPLTLTYVLRNQWGSKALVGPDYGGVHSASSILQGLDMEPGSNYFGTTNLTGTDPTGSACADSTGASVDCTAAGAVHIAGIAGDSASCGTKGCSVANAAVSGALPISVFNESLARMLYQEERFGLLGCDNSSADCDNPGGVDGDRTGTAALPTGSTSGKVKLGTKNGDAAVVEKIAEESGTLLKNTNSTLPITSKNLKKGIAVSGANGEYLIVNPNAEGAVGYSDRNAVGPLAQLKNLSGNADAFSYTPAGSPTGSAVVSSALSTSDSTVTGGLTRTIDTTTSVDKSLDFTTSSDNGQLGKGSYTWTGYVYVPSSDKYTFRFQYDSDLPSSAVTFSLDGTAQTLSTADSFYNGTYGRGTGTQVQVGTTVAGYTEAGLTNVQAPSNTLSAGYHAVTITFDNTTDGKASFRFADSLTNADIKAAAADAKGKSMAVVFANDANSTDTFNLTSSTKNPSLPDDQVKLISAVAGANPNTVVVLNTAQAVVTKPWISLPGVKSVLEMWNAGSEGGTATARLLLGKANPSGHTTVTWPVNDTDTIYSYNQKAALYDGDTTGKHPERASVDSSTDWTQGIYTGYRYFDKLGAAVQFPFGYGLSYSTFKYSGLKVTRTSDGGLDVTFKLKNTSKVDGAEAPQVYLGAPGNQPKGIQFAVRSLAQFDRVELAAGQTKTVTEHVDLRQLQYWSPADQQWVQATGSRTVYVGGANRLASLPLKTEISIPAATNITCANQELNSMTVNGNLTVKAGTWCDLSNVTIKGSLKADKATGLRLVNSTVKNDVELTDTKAANDPISSGANTICSSTIGGDLTASGSAGKATVRIGNCGATKVGGDVTLKKNKATDNTVQNTTVKGNLACTGNGGVTATGDTVEGKQTGQCAFSPALRKAS